MSIAKRIMAAAAAVAVLSASAPSTAAEPAPSAHRMELARRLFSDMHMDRMLGQMTAQMAPAMADQMRKGNPNLTADQARAISEAVNEAMVAATPKIVDRMIPLYASTLTDKELEDTVAFYEGPSGRAILEKLPALTAKIAPTMSELMPEMTADIQRRICAKTDCSKLQPPPRS